MVKIIITAILFTGYSWCLVLAGQALGIKQAISAYQNIDIKFLNQQNGSVSSIKNQNKQESGE